MSRLTSLLSEREKLEAEISNLSAFIQRCPSGQLVARKSDSRSGFEYSKKEKIEKGKYKEHYLPQEELSFAELLAKRDYSTACLKDRMEQLDLVNREIAICSHDSHSETYLKQHPGAAALLLPKLKAADEYVKKWQAAPYIKSNLHPEHLIYPTIIPGLMVRSKAEGDIIMRLTHRQVPFRYEELAVINGIALHPDFTCLNVRTHEVFYIEHQGKWDDPKYVADVRAREDLYLQAKIYPWKKLLITTETKDQPFDILWFDRIIDYYLK